MMILFRTKSILRSIAQICRTVFKSDEEASLLAERFNVIGWMYK